MVLVQHLHTSAYVSIRQHTSAYVSLFNTCACAASASRMHCSACGSSTLSARFSIACIRQHMSAYVISDTCCPVSRAHYIYTCVLYIQKKGTEGIPMLYIQVAYAAYVSCMLMYAEICICEHTSAYRTLTLLTRPVCKIHRRHLLCREHYIYLLCVYI